MTIPLAFTLGLLLGGTLCVVLMCLLALAGRASAQERGE